MISKQLLDINELTSIEKVEYKSDEHMNRVRIYFKNGHELSVIRGDGSFGGEDGLFEIAPYSKGKMDGNLLDGEDREEDRGGDVCGYLSVDRVNYYINKIGSL